MKTNLLISDCLNMREHEPMVGLSELLVGAIASSLKRSEVAINAYRECISKRTGINDKYGHISVLSHVELASQLLLIDQKVKQFSVQIYQQVFKCNYYF